MMTRKPDEIKKGLEMCIMPSQYIDCKKCPYFEVLACGDELKSDALALIQQLQADNAQLNRCIENMTDKLNAMNDEVSKLQAERDAAVKSLRGRCFECKHNKTSVCLICSKDKELKNWQWRGVQKEESDDGKE